MDHEWASFGGVVRNNQGKWMEGFCGRIGQASPLKAELWGIRKGLQLAKERGWKKIITETDSQQPKELIETRDIENHSDRVIVEDCRSFEREMKADIIHTLREGNRVADMMTKKGINQGEKSIRVMVPPVEVVEILRDDMIGVAVPRDF